MILMLFADYVLHVFTLAAWFGVIVDGYLAAKRKNRRPVVTADTQWIAGTAVKPTLDKS